MALDNTTDVMDQAYEAERAADESRAVRENAPERSVSLQSIEVAWLLWSQRGSLARWAAWGLALCTIVAFLIPKRYTSTAQLMPPDFSSSSDMIDALPALSMGGDDSGSGSGASGAIGGGGAGIMGIAGKLLGMNSPGQLMAGVLQSRTIEDHLIQRFGLMDLYSEDYPEDTRKQLEAYTAVKVDTDTGIISISVEDKDPKRAAAMAQAYVDELNELLAQVNTSSAHRERQFVEQRLAEVKTDMDSSAKDFSIFASQNTAIDIPEQAKAMVGAAADLQAQLIASQSMLRGLQQIYTSSNSRVRQMQAQVDELQSQLGKLGGKDVNVADGATLLKGELYPSIRELPLIGVKYLDLYRRSKIDEAVYELLSKELELAKMEEARNVPSIQVLDQANVPQKKTSPHRGLIMLFGTFFCFVLGATWIVAGEYWERTDPDQPWKVFALEVFVTTRAHTWDSPRGQRIRARFSRIRLRRRKMNDPQDSGKL